MQLTSFKASKNAPQQCITIMLPIGRTTHILNELVRIKTK
jgi:hypothetical protein